MAEPMSQWCVVCFQPLGDAKTRRFPDGCVAHADCFMTADYDLIRHHMTHRPTPAKTPEKGPEGPIGTGNGPNGTPAQPSDSGERV